MGGKVRVTKVVALVAVLVVGVKAQDAFFNNYAFTKVMLECLGDSVYQDYLLKVAEARRACGGSGVFNIPRGTLFSSIFPGTFTPQQGLPIHQPGLFLQQPSLLPRPGVLFHHQPGVATVFPQKSVLQQPRLSPQQPGIFPQQPGIFSQQPGVISRPANIFPQQLDLFGQQGSSSQPNSVFTQPPGIFSTDSNRIFSSGTDSPSSVTFSPERDTDPFVVLSPLSPRLPNIRQKRALVLGSGEVLVVRTKMEALLGNLTCILKTLAVVDDNLNINYDALATNTFNLPLHQLLKDDLLRALEYCRATTLCLPVEKLGSPVTPQLQRLMFFIKCEKEMRLSACLKHDLRRTIGQMDVSGLPGGGSKADHIERLLSYLVGAESANELELI